VCREDREELYGALKHETVALRCEVDANPPPVVFHWTFNNSGDLNEVPVHRFVSSGTISHLNYTPVTDMDYGTLACSGQNSVGRQRVPCMYQVVAAGQTSIFSLYELLKYVLRRNNSFGGARAFHEIKLMAKVGLLKLKCLMDSYTVIYIIIFRIKTMLR